MRGVVTVHCQTAQFSVSSYRAVAIPAWLPHKVSASGNAALRSIFIDAKHLPTPQPAPAVLAISPLLHELVNEAGQRFGDEQVNPESQQILDLISSLLPQQPAMDGFVVLPSLSHAKLATFFAQQEDALLHQSADAIARQLALSPRQFRRLFKADCGMTFSTWRTLNRVRRATELIALGYSMTHIASEVGCSSSSALTEIFKRHTGMTPTDFCRR